MEPLSSLLPAEDDLRCLHGLQHSLRPVLSLQESLSAPLRIRSLQWYRSLCPQPHSLCPQLRSLYLIALSVQSAGPGVSMTSFPPRGGEV